MKVLVSDFDNTFYPDNYLDNIKEANRFVNLGNVFILATGRNIKSLLRNIETFNINYSYLICNDGATIFDKDKKLIKSTNIENNIAIKVFEYLKLFYDQVYYDNEYELVLEIPSKVNGIVARFTEAKVAHNVLKIIEKEYPSVHGYLSENYINITSIDASKANAINYLELLNDYRQVFVTGDKINDISMFKNYYGISLANSIPELKELAKEHVDDFIDVVSILKRM
jgi:5-amino-6-(5-phospho-D-ribitylamino)uracil phosphatase